MHKHMGTSGLLTISKQKRSEADAKEACTKRREMISVADLPLACPPRDDRVWDAHPRVYLPIEDTINKEFLCPYCGTLYIIEDPDKLTSNHDS